MFYALRGELQTARELGEQLLRLAQSVQDSALLLEAHYALGVPLYWLGEFTLVRAHFEQGLALYDPQQHRSSPSPHSIGASGEHVALGIVARHVWHARCVSP